MILVAIFEAMRQHNVRYDILAQFMKNLLERFSLVRKKAIPECMQDEVLCACAT